MIITRVFGGLGNQLFQYAAGKALSIVHNTSLVLDTRWYNNQKYSIDRKFELDKFKIEAKEITKKDIHMFYPHTNIQKLRKKVLSHLGKLTIATDKPNNPFTANFFQLPINTYLNGFWQNSKYFDVYRSAILSSVQLTDNLSPEAIKYKNITENKSSLSLHVRRNDYVTHSTTSRLYGTCTADYYKEAFNKIEKTCPSHIQLVFSDDISWCEKNLSWLPNAHFVKGLSAHEDLVLMSLCSNNIIANSSFSWWGAWLNENPHKTVIAPKRWFANAKMNKQSTNLVPESWMQL